MQGNLFNNAPRQADGSEFVQTLLAQPGARIERIVSTGQSSPVGFWYDQAQVEWVAMLQGEALLRFDDEHEPRRLVAGDWLTIAAHRRHRVDWTTPGTPTVWLAVYLTET